MSVTDSEANFKARAKTVGLADDVVQLFVDAKVNAPSLFAFSSSYVPGGADERPFLDAMKLIMKRDPTVAEASSLRRLLHESYAVSQNSSSQWREVRTGLPSARPPRKDASLRRAEAQALGHPDRKGSRAGGPFGGLACEPIRRK